MHVDNISFDEAHLASAAATIVLSILILVTFLLLIVLSPFSSTSTAQKALARLLGGLVILLFALGTDNPYVQSISIFIGGLLIASENFLFHLAAVFRGSKGSIPSIIKNYRKLSNLEAADKQVDELKEIDSIAKGKALAAPSSAHNRSLKGVKEKPGKHKRSSSEIVDSSDTDNEPFKEDFFERLQVAKKATDKVLQRFEIDLAFSAGFVPSYIKYYVETQIGGSNVKIDGAVFEDKSNRLLSVIEVKYMDSLNSNYLMPIIKHTASRITSPSHSTVIAIVVKKYDSESVSKTIALFKDISSAFNNLNFALYSMDNPSEESNLNAMVDINISTLIANSQNW